MLKYILVFHQNLLDLNNGLMYLQPANIEKRTN